MSGSERRRGAGDDDGQGALWDLPAGDTGSGTGPGEGQGVVDERDPGDRAGDDGVHERGPLGDVDDQGDGPGGEPDDGAAGAGDAGAELVGERVVARQCAVCGGPIALRATGRPPVVCSHACRQRRWALRAAAARLGRPELAEPRVVREVVERVVVRLETRVETRVETVVRAAPEPEPSSATDPVPDRAREWVELLGELERRLQDLSSPVAAEHWHHARLAAELERVWSALERAHPGRLGRRRH